MLACCRSSYARSCAEDVHRCSTQVNWEAFLKLVRRHRIQGIVAQALAKAEVIPEEAIADKILKDRLALVEHNLRSAAECIRLREGLQEAEVPVLFIKGLPLSALAYGDPFIKMSRDIDILVFAEDIQKAADVLKALGYSMIAPVPSINGNLSRWHLRRKESEWYSTRAGVVIELHSRLADNPTLIPRIGMCSTRQQVRIEKSELLPTLETQDLLLYLCVHGASSAWFRLKWIADFAALLHRSDFGCQQLYNISCLGGADRAAGQALLLGSNLGLIDLPSSLHEQLLSERGSRWLAKIAMTQLTQNEEPTRRPLGTLSIHLSQLLLTKRLPFKVREAVRQVRDVLENSS